jgi:hypothetical protein
MRQKISHPRHASLRGCSFPLFGGGHAEDFFWRSAMLYSGCSVAAVNRTQWVSSMLRSLYIQFIYGSVSKCHNCGSMSICGVCITCGWSVRCCVCGKTKMTADIWSKSPFDLVASKISHTYCPACYENAKNKNRTEN